MSGTDHSFTQQPNDWKIHIGSTYNTIHKYSTNRFYNIYNKREFTNDSTLTKTCLIFLDYSAESKLAVRHFSFRYYPHF